MVERVHTLFPGQGHDLPANDGAADSGVQAKTIESEGDFMGRLIALGDFLAEIEESSN